MEYTPHMIKIWLDIQCKSRKRIHKISSKFYLVFFYFFIFNSLFCVYRDAEEQAEKIASEIENQPAYKERIDLENGDEEQRFAAVERPVETNNTPHGSKGN